MWHVLSFWFGFFSYCLFHLYYCGYDYDSRCYLYCISNSWFSVCCLICWFMSAKITIKEYNTCRSYLLLTKVCHPYFFFMYLWIIVLKDVICLWHLTNYICDTFQCILCFYSSFYIMYFKFTFQNLNSSLFPPSSLIFTFVFLMFVTVTLPCKVICCVT